MIDIDKMKAAFAATALCQKQQDSPTSPTRLCAISALVSFAGVQPALIARMQATEPETVRVEVSERPSDWADVQRRRPSIDHDYAVMLCPRWVADLALPVLQAEYGIPRRIAAQFPNLFDGEANEWRGVEAVLRLCERANSDMLHDAALQEDYARSQQALVIQLQQQTNHAARAAAMASVTSFEKMWQIMEADLKKQPFQPQPVLPVGTVIHQHPDVAGVRPAINTLRRAIEDPGPFPLYHADVMARIRTEWPTLMQAVDAILEADAR